MPGFNLRYRSLPENCFKKEINALENSKAFLNILKEAEIPVIHGVLNFPAQKGYSGNVHIAATEAVVKDRAVTLAKDGIEANNQHRETIKTILSEAGLGCKEKETLEHTSLEKIADMLSVGIQALMGTTFIDAANTETPTGKIFAATLNEFTQIAQQFGVEINRDTIFTTMANKGNFKGSMHPDLTGGKETEKNIFATLAEFAGTLGIEAPTLQQTHDMLAYAEKSKEHLATLRGNLGNVSDAAQFMAIDVENMQVQKQVLSMVI